MNERQDAGREPRHPIRVVARRTGISLHVLRAWERRYEVVEPVRTPGGQRLYSDADIERLVRLREAVESGRPISQVATLSDRELRDLLVEDRAAASRGVASAAPVTASGATEADAFLAACLEAAEKLEEDTLHRLLLRGLVALRPMDFIEGLVTPLLFQIGEKWHAGELRPSHEHAASIAVRRVLTFLLSAYEPRKGAPTLVTTSVAGDPHEFGSMLASVLGAEAGWRVLYLGPSLPAEEIARAAAVSGASAVAVSAVDDRGADVLVRELERLRALLPADTRLLAGGRAIENHAAELAGIDALELADLRLLRETLQLAEVGA